jgi:hypothetical protein
LIAPTFFIAHFFKSGADHYRVQSPIALESEAVLRRLGENDVAKGSAFRDNLAQVILLLIPLFPVFGDEWLEEAVQRQCELLRLLSANVLRRHERGASATVRVEKKRG